MSYLKGPSLFFTGEFLCDVSTVNNDVRHYDNSTFEARFQDPREGQIQNGWWNPRGGAIFQFENCFVQNSLLSDGSSDSKLNGFPVTNTDDRSGGKMVDLDPQTQMTSELWGVKYKLSDKDGNLIFSGNIHHTGFRDLSNRQFDNNLDPAASNGQALGATYYSVIQEIEWGNSDNAVIKELKQQTDDDKLRIKLTVYGYNTSDSADKFTIGKMLGVVTTWKKTEPIRFTSDRRLYGMVEKKVGNNTATYFAYSNFNVAENQLTVDLGMSIPLTEQNATVNDAFTSFSIAVANDSITTEASTTKTELQASQLEVLKKVTISNPKTWLQETNGFVQVALTDDQMKKLENHQLLILMEENGKQILYARETPGGWYVRADQNVRRLDVGQKLTTDFYVYQWGKPAANQQVKTSLLGPIPGLGGSGVSNKYSPKAKIPVINLPAKGFKEVDVSTPAPTDQNGKTTVTLVGEDPGNPRVYLDGQIYWYSYSIDGVKQLDQYSLDYIFVHQRNKFDYIDNPTWDDVKDIWIQFGNLYPIMSHHIMNFSVPLEILKKKDILIFAFSENIDSPLYMPVTRDLSENKLKTLIQWMKITDPADVKASEVAAESVAAIKEVPVDDQTNEALTTGDEEEAPHPIVLLTRQKNSGISNTPSEKI